MDTIAIAKTAHWFFSGFFQSCLARLLCALCRALLCLGLCVCLCLALCLCLCLCFSKSLSLGAQHNVEQPARQLSVRVRPPKPQPKPKTSRSGSRRRSSRCACACASAGAFCCSRRTPATGLSSEGLLLFCILHCLRSLEVSPRWCERQLTSLYSFTSPYPRSSCEVSSSSRCLRGRQWLRLPVCNLSG